MVVFLSLFLSSVVTLLVSEKTRLHSELIAGVEYILSASLMRPRNACLHQWISLSRIEQGYQLLKEVHKVYHRSSSDSLRACLRRHSEPLRSVV